MEINWFIIGGVLILGICLIVYLVRQNQKDKTKVLKDFNDLENNFKDDESELNNEK